MKFGFELVDSTQKLERWNRITIEGQSGPLQAWQGKSAPWLLRTFGPCRLYVCFFTFYGEERPAIEPSLPAIGCLEDISLRGRFNRELLLCAE
jgi:hypothetical protein